LLSPKPKTHAPFPSFVAFPSSSPDFHTYSFFPPTIFTFRPSTPPPPFFQQAGTIPCYGLRFCPTSVEGSVCLLFPYWHFSLRFLIPKRAKPASFFLMVVPPLFRQFQGIRVFSSPRLEGGASRLSASSLIWLLRPANILFSSSNRFFFFIFPWCIFFFSHRGKWRLSSRFSLNSEAETPFAWFPPFCAISENVPCGFLRVSQVTGLFSFFFSVNTLF